MTGPWVSYVRSAIRSLGRTPVLSLAAVLSLAVGIGANAAIFSIFNQTLLKQLPVQQPEQLVTLTAPGEKQGRTSSSSAGGSDAVVSYPLFRDLERGQQSFAGIAAHREISANIAHRSRTSNELALVVSGSYFPVLGLRPALGRLLTPDDDRTPGAHNVVVLSHAYWRARFGGDPSILNDSIVINGLPMTVVGVAPRGFEGTTVEELPRAFVPLSMSAAIHSDYEDLENRHVTVRGFEAGPDADLDASTTLVGPQFFSTLGIPLITGREFTRADTSTSQSVAIVNEAFAKNFDLARDAVVGTRRSSGATTSRNSTSRSSALFRTRSTPARRTARRRSFICRIASARVCDRSITTCVRLSMRAG